MDIEKNINYGISENIAKNIIIVDGITRSGKTLFNSIIPSLECVEHTQVYNLIEQIVPAVSLRSIDPVYAKALFRMTLNELVYNNSLSRNTNFRCGDNSGILKYKDPEVYWKRLTRPEGDDIVEELRNGRQFLPIRTHEIMVNLEWFDLLDIDYYMLEVFRNPMDIIHSWWKRGWGERFGRDPRSFTLTIEFNGQPLPWYCVGKEAEWLNLNPIERCVHTVTDLIKRAVEQYKKVSEKSRIHIIPFEMFLQNPQEHITNISQFLGTKPTVYTDYILRKDMRLSILDPKDRERKRLEIQKGVKKELFDRAIKLTESYEANLYGLQISK